jgi:hypothetical protein
MIKLASSHRLPAVFDDEPVVDGICQLHRPCINSKNQLNKTLKQTPLNKGAALNSKGRYIHGHTGPHG